MKEYLYWGMGEPWAGQVKLWATLDGIVKVAESADVENLGPDDPTGSKTNITNLKFGAGEPWAGQFKL